MSDVFISYSRKDGEFSKILANRLAETGRDVWVDWEDIPRATNWLHEIFSGIEAADTFVFLVSQHSLISEVCNLEVDRARKHNKRIIPLILQDITDDIETEIESIWLENDWGTLARENWDAIRHLNWIFFTDKALFNPEFDALINALETDLKYIKLHTRLLVRAREWETASRNSSFLLTGEEIDDAEAWLKLGVRDDKQPPPTKLHLAYIHYSRKRSQLEKERLAKLLEARKASEKQAIIARKSSKRSKQLLSIAIITTCIAIVVGIISGIEATNSQTKVILAETQFVQQAQVAATELADIETTKEFVLAQANATITQVAIEQDISFVYVNALWNDIEIIDLIQLDKLVEKYPNQPNSYRSRGGAYYILENYPAALDDYNKAISLNPNFAYAYHNRGNVYIRLGEYETALSDYNQAIELAPEFAVSYYNLGNTYYLMEEFEKAIESYDQAIFHDPNYVYAYHNRGITYSLMGELEKAIESYDQAILLAPDYELFINYRDEAYSLLSTQESADNLQQPTSDLGGHAFGGASAITNTPQAEIIFTPAPQDANAPTTTPTFSFGGGGVDG